MSTDVTTEDVPAPDAPTPPPAWTRLFGDLAHTAEDSLWVRVSAVLALLVAGLAVLQSGVVWGPRMWITVALGIPTLAAVGWWTRRSRSPWPSLVVTVVSIAMAIGFLLGTGGVTSPAELRTPLAELLISLETLRLAIARTRRDIRFTLLSALALMAVAGSAAMSISFAIPLLIWAAASAVCLIALQRSEMVERATPVERPVRRPRPRLVMPAVAALTALAIAVGAFLVIPGAKSSRFLAFTARLPNQTAVPQQGGLSNPSLGDQNPSGAGGGTGDTGEGPSSFGYFGFSNRLDTSIRGRPDDTLVMRVRASAPDFWRGQTFDLFDGRVWTMSQDRTEVITGGSAIPTKASDVDPPVRGSEFIQTYFLETPGPNVIFGAYRTTQVYIPQRALFQMGDGTIRTGVELEQGAVYTVVSHRPMVTEARLRAAGDVTTSVPQPIRDRYTQMSPTPDRVLQLAERLTRNQPTTYDKVRALEAWMAANTQYQIDIPPLPEGANAVDQYLFVDRIGFCEQIASSLVVMLRSQGIPARLAVGFTPGERNPFTGMYEVKAENAHAWTEVYFPGVGWQAFDPTAQVPLSGEERSDVARNGLSDYLRNHLPRPSAGLVAAIVALVAAVFALILWRPILRVVARIRAARERRRGMSWAEHQVLRVERAGRRAGRRREDGETTREYLRSLERTVVGSRDLDRLADALDADAFSPAEPDPEERRRVEEAVERLERELAGRGSRDTVAP